MNKRGHATNAVLLGVGLGYILQPGGGVATFRTIAAVFVPLVLGSVLPDVDTHFGAHRKTMHNLLLLAVVAAYPLYFDNLHWVWLGVFTHYVLDVLGTTRGIALFYPISDEEYGLPVGVPVGSRLSEVTMLAVTALEIAVAAFAVYVLPEVLPADLPENLPDIAGSLPV